MIYNDFIQPELGPNGGRAMFGTLLGVLRGRDGSPAAAETHQAYVAYRSQALRYKDAAATGQDPETVEQLRQARKAALELWRALFLTQVDRYATQQIQLNRQFRVTRSMLKGFHVYVNPESQGPPRLKISRAGNRVIVDFKGPGRLQEAPTPSGPWMQTRKAPPAAFKTSSPAKFFRTLDENGAAQ